MSSKAEHFNAGAVLGVILAGFSYSHYGLFGSGIFLFAALAGSSAPDWLEVAMWVRTGNYDPYDRPIKKRRSLIPHRTITHWFLAWTVGVLLAGFHLYKSGDLFSCFIFGFLLSGWLHIHMDSRTPMGVPWLHPWNRIKPESDA